MTRYACLSMEVFVEVPIESGQDLESIRQDVQPTLALSLEDYWPGAVAIVTEGMAWLRCDAPNRCSCLACQGIDVIPPFDYRHPAGRKVV